MAPTERTRSHFPLTDFAGTKLDSFGARIAYQINVPERVLGEMPRKTHTNRAEERSSEAHEMIDARLRKRKLGAALND